jgi:tRNA(Ile)-lysidine synthase
MPTHSVPSGPCVSKRALLENESNAGSIVGPIHRFQGRSRRSLARADRGQDYVSQVIAQDTTSVLASIHDAVAAGLRPHRRVVLAVSGGLDSMVLLDAAATSVTRERLTVATFDHGTGSAATEARALVERSARALGIRCVTGRASRRLRTEAELRAARWNFLGETAARDAGAVCTAHTMDDQIETVLMRVLRDAGARGLAGLYATTDILRPLIGHTRRELARYARESGVAWIEDPSNASRQYLRNRLRHELLPALRRVSPSIDAALLSTARDAARWRAEVEGFVAEHVHVRDNAALDGLDVATSSLSGFSNEALAILWPAIVARAGVALDRRGTMRLVEFTGLNHVGARMQISGGWEVVRSRYAFQLRASGHRELAEEPLRLSSTVQWGRWSFGPAAEAVDGDTWSAWLPVDQTLSVRSWRAGDAMVGGDGKPGRKVKRLLSDAGVTGHERSGWPVVLAGDQIVWVPGIRRGNAATARSGRPGLAFICEYVNR